MRVLSLLPAATEIVAALGAADSLVGVTHECDYPDAARALPRVTASALETADVAPGEVDRAVRGRSAEGAALFALDEARIGALRPELIVTQALCDVCAVSESDVRAIAARLPAAPDIVTLDGRSLDGVFADVARVANALGAGERGAALVERLRARMRAVHETLKAAAAPRPRVAVIEWTDPVFAAGHWVPEMVRRAGGVDVLARPGEHSRTLALADVAAADPEVVLISPCGYDAARAAVEARRLMADDAWRWLGGRRVWAVDANALVSRPGPRLVDGIETFAAIFNPELFPEPAKEQAIRVQ